MMHHLRPGSYLRSTIGMWRSLVARSLWEREVAGSIPAIPTLASGIWRCRRLWATTLNRQITGVGVALRAVVPSPS